MSLILTEEQEMLQDAANGFLTENAPVAAFREIRDSKNPDGFSRDLWKEMAAMGWAGIIVNEEYGGSEFGYVGAGVLAEQMGRNLTASPFFSTSVLGATAVQRYGTAKQKEQHLGAICDGSTLFALAVDEGPRHRPEHIEFTATPHGNGYKLSGAKTFVADGHVADKLIIAARTSGEARDPSGITLFLVDADAAAIERTHTPMIDSRNAANITVDDLEVTGDDILGEVDGGYEALEGILSAGRAVLGAEMSGSSQQAFDITTDYLKEREQFGQKIGSFQGLQHRAAHLATEIEMTKSAVLKSLQLLDDDFESASATCSMAKAKSGMTAQLSTQEAIQMHGGIGVTDEYDVGLYFKRVHVAQQMFGDAGFHADRLAKRSGY
ncbi:acyl-CoA dehydrogenase family protein [Parasphingorhabdus cellanae]|uniref:Acyl-CoA dehydrogenase family protein n=1 Tax=Parasphingorhabdus cellanae TaxID=2806553 RepID=A0ABX7T0X0_9SPHN|nr:acyl-CoA dehydrogenase [Parasphingorhabdus cellanae]QTD55194.1 acyl-CoA dehydrogenase family protein [Parasphingorhabdus cellanae]